MTCFGSSRRFAGPASIWQSCRTTVTPENCSRSRPKPLLAGSWLPERLSAARPPLIQHVNDDPDVWAELWRSQVQLGAVPYYMFVERDTGPKNYFEVPLADAAEIFRTAYKRVSGLARTVRGPSMSATPGKVVVDGVAEVYGQRVFVLKFLQGRDPDWVGRPFFARYDPEATWLDDLSPAFGQKQFFFERVLRQIKNTGETQTWRKRAPSQQRLKIFGDAD